ncbi:MAG TPA: helix-turn-helix transcriptional regulator [Terracidiphilus sp.]|nr:helix-turn-helix transcriptional regulator [Terracidiphilus sp.]
MENELGIWEIAVLTLLREGPMHPYQMQRLLRQRHKDEILALKRGSLYHAIGRLERDGLILAAATGRQGRRPERTTYRITPHGRAGLLQSLRAIIARPRRESSEFMAAMSFLVHLTPAQAIPRLQERAVLLEAEIAHRSAGLAAASTHVLRINLVESEYLLAMLRAELVWVRGLLGDLRSARLDWNLARIFREIRAETRAAGQPPAKSASPKPAPRTRRSRQQE